MGHGVFPGFRRRTQLEPRQGIAWSNSASISWTQQERFRQLLLAVRCGASGNIQKTGAHYGTRERHCGRRASGSSMSCTFRPARRLAGPPERSVSACLRRLGHVDHGSLAKATASEPFRTTGTAAYPPAMDRAIAESILGSFLEDLRNSGAKKQGGGCRGAARWWGLCAASCSF